MSEKKQLNEEQLEKVTGGRDAGHYLPAGHGGHIGLYEAGAYIGSQVYIVNDDDREIYYWGELVDSYEREAHSFGGIYTVTERTHKVKISGCNNYSEVNQYYVGQTREFDGDDWSLFLMH